MSWWTEPDPQRGERASSSAPTRAFDAAQPSDPEAGDAATQRLDVTHDATTAPAPEPSFGDAVTVSYDTTDHGDAPTERIDAHEAPTTPLDEPSTRTTVMPTSLIPREGPAPNDAPTVAVGRLAPAQARPQRIVGGVPIEQMPLPASPRELQAARSHRTGHRRLSGFGWLRLLLGQLLLLAAVVLLAAGYAPIADADLAAAWNPVTQAGLGVLLAAWIVLPGPIGGTIAAIVLSGIAWVSVLVGHWVLGTQQLQDTIGSQASSMIINWVVPIAVLTLAALAWIVARGKHPASVVVLVVPIVVAVAAGLVVPDGWLFGSQPSEWWVAAADAVTPVLAGWAEGWPELAASIGAGIDGWIRVAAAVLPAMLLAWPLRSTNTALRR